MWLILHYSAPERKEWISESTTSSAEVTKRLTSHDVAHHFDGASSEVENLMYPLLELEAEGKQDQQQAEGRLRVIAICFVLPCMIT